MFSMDRIISHDDHIKYQQAQKEMDQIRGMIEEIRTVNPQEATRLDAEFEKNMRKNMWITYVLDPIVVFSLFGLTYFIL